MLNQSRAALVEALTRHLGGPDGASKRFQLQLSLDPYPAPAYRLIYLGRGGLDVDKIYVDPLTLGRVRGWLRSGGFGVTYVVLKRYNSADPEMTPLVAELTRHGRLIARSRRSGRARRTSNGRESNLSCTTPIRGSTTHWSVPVHRWRSGSSMALTRRLRDKIATRARAIPLARHAWARYRRRTYEQRIERFVREKTGRADRLPIGAVYEATMRCNLHCEFCYVGDLLNIEGEWRQELTLDALDKAFPDRKGSRSA